MVSIWLFFSYLCKPQNFFTSVFKESFVLFTMSTFLFLFFSLNSQWHLKMSNWYITSDSCHVTILLGPLLFIECCGILVSIYLLKYCFNSRQWWLWGWHSYCQCQEGLRPCKAEGEMREEGEAVMMITGPTWQNKIQRAPMIQIYPPRKS